MLICLLVVALEWNNDYFHRVVLKMIDNFLCLLALINLLDKICANTACIDIHLSHIGLFGLGVLLLLQI